MGISAILLTHNSGETIKRALDSVKFCDEVIVVDDGSQDATLAIVRKAGAKIFSRKVNGDFAAQRNYALEQASGEWVLYLDADEYVRPELALEIRKSTERMEVNGFYLKRQDTLWGVRLKYGETGNVRLMRLARKDKGKWVRPVHEVWEVSGLVGTLNNPIEHTPHPSVTHFLDSVNRYSSINAKYLFDARVPDPFWQIVAYPVVKFFRTYIIMQGFRDGEPGIIVAIMMSFHSFLTRAKLWKLYHPHP